jgi:hypothetical protein
LKYKRLTKEQLEELQPEFINFLATQSMTGEEWKNLKEDKPAVAEDEVDIFAFVCLFLDKVVFVPNKNVGKTYQKKVEFISEIQTLETLVSSAQVVRDLKL